MRYKIRYKGIAILAVLALVGGMLLAVYDNRTVTTFTDDYVNAEVISKDKNYNSNRWNYSMTVKIDEYEAIHTFNSVTSARYIKYNIGDYMKCRMMIYYNSKGDAVNIYYDVA